MMKTIRTALFTLLVICFCTSVSKAQWKRFSIGPYVEAGFPAGDFADEFKTGFGAGASADVKLIMGLAATGSVGYMYFRGKRVDNEAGGTRKIPDLGAVPIKVGLKYRFIPLLYVKVEGGVANYTGKYDGSAAIFSPGIGLRVLGFDFQARYEAWFKDGTRGFWGLRAGWNF